MPSPTDDKLDAILAHLDRMDRRDRWRTIGGFCRAFLSLIPLVVFLWGIWYTYEHFDEMLARMAAEAAKQAAIITEQESASLMEQMRELLPHE